MQSADSNRNLFGALDYSPSIKTYVGDINMEPTLSKLDQRVQATDNIIAGLPKPKALSGIDSAKRDQEFNNDLNYIQEAAKESNLYNAYRNVKSKANEFANKVKAGSYGALEKSLNEFEQRQKSYNDMVEKGDVLSDEASTRLLIDKYKHDLQGGTTPNKLGGHETFAKKSPDNIKKSISAAEFVKQLELHDVGYKQGQYIDPNSTQISPAARGVFDTMYKTAEQQGVSPERAFQYSKQIFDSSPEINRSVRQRAVTNVVEKLKQQGFSEEEAAAIIAQDELSGGKSEIYPYIANEYNQLADQYVKAGAQHLYKSIGGVEFKGAWEPASSKGAKEKEIQDLNAPRTPTAFTTNPQAVDELADLNISPDGKVTTNEYYFTDAKGNKKPISAEEYAKGIATFSTSDSPYSVGRAINTPYSKEEKKEQEPIKLYQTNPKVKEIVDSAAEVERLTNPNLPKDWKFGPKFIAGNVANYKEAIKNYKNVAIDERINSAKKQKYKTTIAKATLSNRTYIPLSTANRATEESGMNFEDLIKKYGEIESVTSSGSASSNPYNAFPVSDNLEIKFKGKEAPLKFITNLPDEEVQEAAKPLQNFMNVIYSGKPAVVKDPYLGELKVLASYKNKKPEFIILTKDGNRIKNDLEGGYIDTPEEIEKFYHKNIIFPRLKKSELSYYGSEDKTDPNATETTE